MRNYYTLINSMGSGGLPPSTLLTNLYAVYNAENNANDSLNTYNGTAVGGLTYSTGKIGNAFQFNGTNAYVSLPNTSFRLTGDFSISCFVYFNSLSIYNIIFENYHATSSSNRYGFSLYQQSNKIRFSTCNVSTAITVGSTTLTTGQWYHIVVTKALSNNPKIYVNGVLETMTNGGGSVPQSLNPAYDANLNIPKIGVEYDINTFGGYLNGKIDALNIWTKELTASEVSELYNSGNGTQYPF